MAPRRRASHVNGPEVLVDATAMRGLRQLDAIVRDGRTQFVFTDEHVLQEPVRDIEIVPISIAPIEVATFSEEPGGNSEGDRP